MSNAAVWTEHRNAEGRTYWYNTGSKESVWEKPEDLKTPFERALAKTSWKEYFSGGRKYYYNTDTKESKWDMPDELLTILEKVEKENNGPLAPPTAAPSFVPGVQGATLPPSSLTGTDPSTQNGLNGTDGAVVVAKPGGPALPFTPSSVLPARPNLGDDPVIPHNGFATAEEAEKAFNHLLRKAGVDANWTWDQTMRAIITDPLYKALNSLAEKKAAWQKYTNHLRAKEVEEREARLSKLRPAIRNMLKGNPSVFHYTTFRTADKLFAHHPIWQQAKIESERRLLFEEYVKELQQREEAAAREARNKSIAKIVVLFKQLGVDVLTRWRHAQSAVMASEEWKRDPELQKLPALDMLLAFEDYSRVKEREYEEGVRKAQIEKTRRERKARESFRDLLQDMVKNGQIVARSKWKNVYPSFANDDRYLSLLGNPGSNPLELFWDVVDQLDQALDAKVAAVDGVFKEKKFTFTTETTEEEYRTTLEGEPNVANLTDKELKEVYSFLHDQARKAQADERRRAERRLRHLQDDLRYALKKTNIDTNTSYDEALPMMQDLEEFKALEDEEARRAAFAKFIKRQKEKLREQLSEDGGSNSGSRKRKEPHGGRDHRDYDSRDHDREERSSSRHHRHRDEYDKRDSKDYYRRDDRDRDRDYSYKSSKHRSHRDERGSSRSRKEDDKSREKDRRDSREPVRSRDDDVEMSDAKSASLPAKTREDTPEEGEI